MCDKSLCFIVKNELLVSAMLGGSVQKCSFLGYLQPSICRLGRAFLNIVYAESMVFTDYLGMDMMRVLTNLNLTS